MPPLPPLPPLPDFGALLAQLASLGTPANSSWFVGSSLGLPGGSVDIGLPGL
ncbi:hypothetical protein GCM10023094_42230 [Rhodococcus olei]|uniref:Uncharacterized protein n=1 Tax=Rhodococcus olei TaxID=2161675 RepID=A0ABP8PGI4_9NOCA